MKVAYTEGWSIDYAKPLQSGGATPTVRRRRAGGDCSQDHDLRREVEADHGSPWRISRTDHDAERRQDRRRRSEPARLHRSGMLAAVLPILLRAMLLGLTITQIVAAETACMST